MTENLDDGEGKVPSVFKRKLDLAPTASKDVVGLNNVIVKMRPKVHASKMVVISKLRNKIKHFKKMRTKDDLKQVYEERASEREKEIALIKALRHDHVSKFAIGSTDKLETIFPLPNVSLEQKALVRLASHKYIQDVVQEFRKNHHDWKELGAYLMTKHTNREFKKKKKKPDLLSTEMKQLKRKKTKTNIEASEMMVKSYLKEKLINEDIESGAESDEEEEKKPDDVKFGKKDRDVEDSDEDSGNEGSDGDDGSDDDDDGNDDDEGGDAGVSEGEEIDKYDIGNSDSDIVNESEESDTDGSNYNFSGQDTKSPLQNDNKVDVKTVQTISKSNLKKDRNKGEKSNMVKKCNDFDDKTRKTSETIDKAKKKKEAKVKSDSVEKKPLKPKTLEKSQGEIIVKKLNLDDWSFSDPSQDKVPAILTKEDTSNVSADKEETDKPKKKKTASDPFFDTGNRSFQSRDSKPGELGKNLLAFAGYTVQEEDVVKPPDNAAEEEEIHDYSAGVKTNNNERIVDDYDDIFNEKSRRDGSVYMKANNIGKQAFRTTFMESLNSSGMNEFSGRGKFSKRDKHSDRDKVKGRGRHLKEREFDTKKVGVSAGTKAKLKKKGMFQVRDSKQDELGSSLLTIAGYDKEGSKTGSSTLESGSDRGFWDRKGDNSRGKKDNFGSKNPIAQSHGSSNKPEIHPSWEASRKRKLQQSGKVEFAGKKIKFDD